MPGEALFPHKMKIMPKEKLTIGKVLEIRADAAETKQVPWVLMTESRARDGSIMDPAKTETKNFRKNPVVGYMHNLYNDGFLMADPDFIIGKDVGTKVTAIDGIKALIGTTEFEPAEINPLAEKIFRKILFGSISAVSVSVLEKGEGQWRSMNGLPTYYLAGQELIEYSVVHIPMDPGAVKHEMKKVNALGAQAMAAIEYACRELGAHLRRGQIEEMRIRDLLDLFDAWDRGVRTGDPDRARSILMLLSREERLRFLRNKES